MAAATMKKRRQASAAKGTAAPAAVQAIRSRRARLIGLRVQHHLAPDWVQRYERDYGRKARAHLIPGWQLLPYCDA